MSRTSFAKGVFLLCFFAKENFTKQKTEFFIMLLSVAAIHMVTCDFKVLYDFISGVYVY